TGLGIDLDDNGPSFPQTDSGPAANGGERFPILSAVSSSAGGTTISGSLQGTSGTTQRIEFFASAEADPTGFGEGQTFLGSTTVSIGSAGSVTFTANLSALPAAQTLVSATATDITLNVGSPTNNTSEFSPVFGPPKVFTVTTTADSGAGSLRDAITAANAWQ